MIHLLFFWFRVNPIYFMLRILSRLDLRALACAQRAESSKISKEFECQVSRSTVVHGIILPAYFPLASRVPSTIYLDVHRVKINLI